ncbi:MAG: VOC family protein [Myxococcales bacterium]|nr:VOC family protein [Myxococcales bacterium]
MRNAISWHELYATDVERAKAFYAALFGWTYAAFEATEDPYWVIHDGSQQTGGIMKNPHPDEMPASWGIYVEVEDTDQTAERVRQLGGHVAQAPWDIPTVGRLAVFADPQGAVFMVLRPDGPPSDAAPSEPPRAGQFCWYELSTPDPRAAQRFYSGLFGWETEAPDIGAGERASIFKAGGGPFAGVSTPPAGSPAPPHWGVSIAVADCDDAVGRVKALGGVVHVAPFAVGAIGRSAVCADPGGATFALFEADMAGMADLMARYG